MPYITFTFENTNPDQTFEFSDKIDSTANPHVIGPINHGDMSQTCQCWAGGNGKGLIVLTGSVSGNLQEEIPEDGYSFRY